MTTPASNQNESSKMRRYASESVNESIRDKLPPARVDDPPVGNDAYIPTPPVYRATAPDPEPEPRRFQFLPALWTIASVLSLTINVILIIILLLAWQMLRNFGGLGPTAMGKASGLLGGLYDNFVRMDQANIRTNIHVEKDIPVNFQLNVSGPTRVTLTQPVRIDGAVVSVHTGGLTIVDADASIVLPQGVVLPITIENLVVPVDKKVLAVLDVPVNIPLSQTELHAPFVGLRQVVKPWYCLINPSATFNGAQVCSPLTDETLVDPALRNPAPVETAVP
ncbi:MAG TPA: hypothetical protein VK206_26385 [Anaerolineales bacterium]|nr:hypothetical protein [Anaerolineales bacterium]